MKKLLSVLLLLCMLLALLPVAALADEEEAAVAPAAEATAEMSAEDSAELPTSNSSENNGEPTSDTPADESADVSFEGGGGENSVASGESISEQGAVSVQSSETESEKTENIALDASSGFIAYTGEARLLDDGFTVNIPCEFTIPSPDEGTTYYYGIYYSPVSDPVHSRWTFNDTTTGMSKQEKVYADDSFIPGVEYEYYAVISDTMEFENILCKGETRKLTGANPGAFTELALDTATQIEPKREGKFTVTVDKTGEYTVNLQSVDNHIRVHDSDGVLLIPESWDGTFSFYAKAGEKYYVFASNGGNSEYGVIRLTRNTDPHTITVSTPYANWGSMTINGQNVSSLSVVPGETVTIVATPATGYKNGACYSLDSYVEITHPTPETYSFTMPAREVNLQVSFVPPEIKDETTGVTVAVPDNKRNEVDSLVFVASKLPEDDETVVVTVIGTKMTGKVEKSYVLDIYFADASTDEKVVVDGQRMVTIPIPEGWNAKNTMVLFVDPESGRVENMRGIVSADGKTISFVTDHFSYYALVQMADEPEATPTPTATPATAATPTPTATPQSPKTGDEGHIGLWLAVLSVSALAGVAVIARRKRGER